MNDCRGTVPETILTWKGQPMSLRNKEGRLGKIVLCWQEGYYLVLLNGMEFERHPELIQAIRIYDQLALRIG